MGQMLDVTLVGISCEYNLNGDNLAISGHLYAKSFYRDRTEKQSEDLFFSDSPINLAVGETYSIDKNIRIALTYDETELHVFAEHLALGGNLSIGSQRYLIIPASNTTGELTLKVRFTSEDSSQSVQAVFLVKYAHPL